MTRPRVSLISKDGNAYVILARCSRAMREAGWPPEKADAVLAEMREGDYDHLLRTAMKYFDVD